MVIVPDIGVVAWPTKFYSGNERASERVKQPGATNSPAVNCLRAGRAGRSLGALSDGV